MTANLPSNTKYVTVAELVERWQSTPSRVHRLIEDRYLAALKIDGVMKVPADLAGEHEPLRSLRGTLLALHDAGFNNEEAIAWMLQENDELGERPIDTLKDGRKSAVRRATQSLAF